MMNSKKNILFLCTGNSCRSQMAEGIMRQYYSDEFDVFSAGTNPSSLNPHAVSVMNETGIDISSHSSKSVELYLDKSFDYVITVCDDAKETCPVFPGGVDKKLHWSFEDPADAEGSDEEISEIFREVRDLIKNKITSYFG
ncbi:arsenate reductase ArsC [candidate division KSB1 bacterium]